MWGVRVVIPPKTRGFVLKELHQSHPGIVRMKSLARLICVAARNGQRNRANGARM